MAVGRPAVVTVRAALTGLRNTRAEVVRATQRRKRIPGEHDAKLFLAGIRARWDAPAPTAMVIPKLFHPTEPRLFTIPELRRLCSFPEDFQI